jgi:EmrB/QacA subfamily drug resistance transporter
VFANRRRVALVVLCTASFIAVADTTIVAIALPSMREALGFSTSGLPWVLNAYALTFGGLLLLSGRVGDLYGRRRLFVAGLAVFAGGSMLSGLAWQAEIVIAGRFLQGLGAAAFVPASLALLTATFSRPSARNRAIGVYGATAALGFVVGMVGGGVITQLWGWRWVFFVNVPVALCTLAVSAFAVGESRDRDRPRRLDVLGALTATSGMVSVIYALSAAPEFGWTSVRTLAAGAVGLLLLVAFAVVESRHEAPLVPPSVAVTRPVLVPNAAISLQSMVGVAWLYILTLYFQEVLHHGPFLTGLLFAPMTLSAVVAAPLGGRLATRLGLRATGGLGQIVVAAGVGTMMAGMSPSTPLAVLVSGMVIGEAGFMLSNVSLTSAGTTAVSDDQGGLAAGLLNTSIQVGNGLGLAISAVVIASALSASTAPREEGYADALQLGLLACACFCALALLVTTLGLRHRADGPQARPHPHVCER